MTRRRYLLWGGQSLVLLTVLAMLLPLEARGANGFASPAFEAQWRSVEGAVPNFWGPVVTAREGQREAYAEGTYNGEPGQRLVQYFDKARMEQTTSGGNVTNGLLTVELKTGALQLGNSTFRPYTGAIIGLAGDAGAPGPTYAALSQLPEMEAQQSGSVTRIYNASTNTFTTGTPMTDPNMVFASYLADPSGRYGQNIPKAFADFLARIPGGATPAMGYPISPAFGANVRVNGVDNVPVVIQAFERKVLTYTPSNQPAFQVEFGNIGQHYYTWRYTTIPSGGGTAITAPFAPLPTFGGVDGTGAASTATAYAACASPTAIGAVSGNATSVSVLPVCATTGTAYVDPNSTAYALTATADARTYNATSTAIYREYNSTSTAIANENNTYNATSTAIYSEYYATLTAIPNATSTAFAMERSNNNVANAASDNVTSAASYNATSTAIYREYYATSTAYALEESRYNATSTAIYREYYATVTAIAQETPGSGPIGNGATAIAATIYAGLTATANPGGNLNTTAVAGTVYAGLTATANAGTSLNPTNVAGTVYAGLTATAAAGGGGTGGGGASATGAAAATYQAGVNATGTAAAASGSISNNPGGRPQGSVVPTPGNAATAAAQTATAGAAATATAMQTAANQTAVAFAATEVASKKTATSVAAALTATAGGGTTGVSGSGSATPNATATQAAVAATTESSVQTRVAQTIAAGPVSPNATAIAGTVIAQYTAQLTATAAVSAAGTTAANAAATAQASATNAAATAANAPFTPGPGPMPRSAQPPPPTLVRPARSASQLVPTIPPPPTRLPLVR